jgi:hypothetical protein
VEEDEAAGVEVVVLEAEVLEVVAVVASEVVAPQEDGDKILKIKYQRPKLM